MTLDDAVLVVIDVQNDFCPGGALEVPDGDAVVPVVNRIAPRFPARILSQDWHPPGHLSFASSHEGKAPFETITLAYGEQVLWPDHCVQGTSGAAFHRDLETDGADLVLRKGFRRGIDSYSAFYENDRATSTGLAGYLRSRGISRLFFAGLATDFCVAYSANAIFEILIPLYGDGYRSLLLPFVRLPRQLRQRSIPILTEDYCVRVIVVA